jgi:hypothetical protein
MKFEKVRLEIWVAGIPQAGANRGELDDGIKVPL